MQVDLIYNDGYFNGDDVATPTGNWRIYDGIDREGNPRTALHIECEYGEASEWVWEPTFFSTYLKIGKGNRVSKKTGKPSVEYIHESYLHLRYNNECGE